MTIGSMLVPFYLHGAHGGGSNSQQLKSGMCNILGTSEEPQKL